MRFLLPLAILALVVLAAYSAPPPTAAGPAAARDSTEWANLQILPDSIPRDSLIQMMRGFTQALGVRCDHCHAAAASGEGLDFGSDANPHKEVARGMMRMTWQINREILPAIDGLHGEGTSMVTCATCHRGATRPETAAPARGSERREAAPAEGHEHGGHGHGEHSHG